MFNEVTLIGRVISKPVQGMTKNEKKLAAMFQVDTYDAVRNNFKHHRNEVVCYYKAAERVLNTLTPGDLVAVTGYLDSYSVNENGRQTYRSIVTARKVFMLSKASLENMQDLSEINDFDEEDVLLDLKEFKELHDKINFGE